MVKFKFKVRAAVKCCGGKLLFWKKAFHWLRCQSILTVQEGKHRNHRIKLSWVFPVGPQLHTNTFFTSARSLIKIPNFVVPHLFDRGRTPQMIWGCPQRGNKFPSHQQGVFHVRSSNNTAEHKPERHRYDFLKIKNTFASFFFFFFVHTEHPVLRYQWADCSRSIIRN